VEEVHGQQNTGGLYSALLKLRPLQGSSATSLCEVNFAIALGNEAGGIDKNKKEALIKSIARDLVGEPRRGQSETARKSKQDALELDMEIPNADVKVVHVEDNPMPRNPSIPEVRVDMCIIANDDDHARAICERFQLVTEDDGKDRMWNGSDVFYVLFVTRYSRLSTL